MAFKLRNCPGDHVSRLFALEILSQLIYDSWLPCLDSLCFLLFLSELSLLWRLCFCEAKTTNNAQNAIWCFTTSRTTRVKYKTTEECFFFFFSLLRETWLPSPSLFVSLLLSVSLLSSASLPESLLLDSLLSESLLSLPSSGSCFTFGSGPGG